ncbi:TPA: glycosyltransferase [Morganella morganii]|nr:glycosyltransferase [Morganella morganii]
MISITENDITKNWDQNDSISVSICCITYNQRDYIEKAIDSFLTQKTSFPFEIIIGNDCSTDGTNKILEEYKKKYPNIISIITPFNNIGANKNLLQVFQYAKGDYIALCEGDDYWIDNNKINEQKTILSGAENINLLVSYAWVVGDNNKGKQRPFIPPHNEKYISSLANVLASKWQFASTATYFFKREALKSLPAWFAQATIGDLYLELYLGENGIIVDPKYRAAYRYNANGSWTKTIKKEKFIRIERHLLDVINRLETIKKDIPSISKYLEFKIYDYKYSLSNLYLRTFKISKHIEILRTINNYPNMSTKRKLYLSLIRKITSNE